MSIRKIFILALLAVGSNASAQYDPIMPNYLINDLLHNPAVAGSKSYNPMRLTALKQWAGIERAPQMFTLSFDGLLFQHRVGMGGSIVSQITGPTSFNAVNYYWNYRVPTGKHSFLSFGLSASISQYVMDHGQLDLDDPNDPLLREGFRRSYLPEAGAGLHLYSTRHNRHQYFLGLSALNVLEVNKNPFWQDNQLDVRYQPREYNVMGGYKIKIYKGIAIEPSLVAHTKVPEDPGQYQYSINGRLTWKDSLWVGASYTKDKSIAAFLSFNISRLNILYSYQMSLTDIQTYNYTTHEVSIAILFRRREIKKL